MIRRALAALLLAGCYSPTLSDGQYSCAGGACPDGYSCTTACKLCVKSGESLDDSANCQPDLTMAPLPGCSANGGLRVPGDPGLQQLAFCSALWDHPGVGMDVGATCGNAPDLTAGVGCSIADNCAVGWHPCETVIEVVSKGPGGCPPSLTGFWAARVGANAVDDCRAGMAPLLNVAGCGDLGPKALNCGTLDTVLDAPACAASMGTWVCTSDQAGSKSPASTLTKAALSSGGVMCCID